MGCNTSKEAVEAGATAATAAETKMEEETQKLKDNIEEAFEGKAKLIKIKNIINFYIIK